MVDCWNLRNMAYKCEEISFDINPKITKSEKELADLLNKLSILLYDYEKYKNKGKEDEWFDAKWEEFKQWF